MSDPRLVITGLDAAGRSLWLRDGLSAASAGGPGPRMLWHMPNVPPDVRDESAEQSGMMPGAGGLYYRIAVFPPEGPARERPDATSQEKAGNAGDVSTRDVGMHATNTVDILTVLSGEVWSYQADEPEGKLLKPGDTIILRGTMHSFHNTGDQPCVATCLNINATGGLTTSGVLRPPS